MIEPGQLRRWRPTLMIKGDIRSKTFITIELSPEIVKGSPLWLVLCNGKQKLFSTKMITEYSRVLDDAD